MRELEIWKEYSREEVHDIFSPDTIFTPQTGTWGLQGIVKIPERPRSYVFFVTFGKSQGAFDFDESITDDGVLTWQSQPKQRLQDTAVQDFIGHDDRTDAIHLFLRTRSVVPYTYCGVLGYLVHDGEREQPVNFQWQLLDWPMPVETIVKMGLALAHTTDGVVTTLATEPTVTEALALPFTLYEVPPPSGVKQGPTKTKKFNAVKRPLHPDQDARNRALGLAGEELVLEVERRQLIEAGHPQLAEKVLHVSVVEGDGAGYDIRSFCENGDVRHLEVKTTRNGATSAFFVSPNEIAFSEAHPETFVLVRVFGYQSKTKSGHCYRSAGPLTESFLLVGTEYRASPKS